MSSIYLFLILFTLTQMIEIYMIKKMIFERWAVSFAHCVRGLQGLTRGFSGKESSSQCWRCQRCIFDAWVQKIPWRRAWQPTQIFLPRESHEQRSLAGYSPWGHKELNPTEWLSRHAHNGSSGNLRVGRKIERSPCISLHPARASCPSWLQHCLWEDATLRPHSTFDNFLD